ncbi:MAG: FtsX-like permease family protein [Spirochaetota bacterium]
MKAANAAFAALRIVGSSAIAPKRGRKWRRTGDRRQRAGEGTLSLRGAIFGIGLSLVPFILVLVVADGMIECITSRYLETFSYHLQASSYGSHDDPHLTAALRGIPGIRGAFRELRGSALVVHGGAASPAMVRGVDEGWARDPGVARYLRVVEGIFSIEARRVVLGDELAATLGVKVGDSLSLVTGAGSDAAAKASLFRVAGIVSAGYRDLDRSWVFVSVENAARILPIQSRQDFIGIKADQPYGNTEGLRPVITASLREASEGEARLFLWQVLGWKDLERNLFESFAMTRSLLLVVMGLTVVVAAVNVGSAISMLTIERSRDIAILKSCGATTPFILSVFVLAGGITGLAGSLFGCAVGSLLAWQVNGIISLLERILGIVMRFPALLGGSALPVQPRLLDPAYYLETIPVNLDPGGILGVGAFAIALCLLVSVLPALRAARTPPLEVFRKT